ncbi:hypothetical protein SDC9_133594 [bioreactor metagenome]|uniref:Uncharacterized protein n=1 Tax=bioreactor metagenome TaxID=1076179 RepID=A0A645DB88_9ZZZZ
MYSALSQETLAFALQNMYINWIQDESMRRTKNETKQFIDRCIGGIVPVLYSTGGHTGGIHLPDGPAALHPGRQSGGGPVLLHPAAPAALLQEVAARAAVGHFYAACTDAQRFALSQSFSASARFRVERAGRGKSVLPAAT